MVLRKAKKSNKRKLSRKRKRTNTKKRRRVQKGGMYTADVRERIKEQFGLTDETISAIQGLENSRDGVDYSGIYTIDKLTQVANELITLFNYGFRRMEELSGTFNRKDRKQRDEIYRVCEIAVNTIKQRAGEGSNARLTTPQVIGLNLENGEVPLDVLKEIVEEYMKIFYSNNVVALPEELLFLKEGLEQGASVDDFIAQLQQQSNAVGNDIAAEELTGDY
jgi:hypothetical protein